MRKGKRWVRGVTTESTFPPKGVFKKDARTVARVMASRKVSPKGVGSAIRMIQFFINRGGKGLPGSQRETLERAKRILQQERTGNSPKRSRSSKTRARRSQRSSR